MRTCAGSRNSIAGGRGDTEGSTGLWPVNTTGETPVLPRGRGFRMTTDAKPPARTDIFAEIAARRHAARGELLIAPQPPVLPEGDRGSNRGKPRLETSTNPDESGLGTPVVLALQEPSDGSTFTPAPKLDTAEALRAELGRMRHRYAPFLRNLAPAGPRTSPRRC